LVALEQQIERVTKLLDGPFALNAPAAIVEKERGKLDGLEASRRELQERLAAKG
jgi:valyl-tRNA synthetase